MRKTSLLVAAALLMATIAARADVMTYDFNATFGPTPTNGTGTVTINTTTGSVTSIDATISPMAGNSFSFDSSASLSQSVLTEPNGDMYYAVSISEGEDSLELLFPETSLVGFSGGVLCAASYNNCPNQADGSADSGYGTGSGFGVALTADLSTSAPVNPSVTPEPSSIALLGTGLLGVAGLMRKRFV